MGWLKNWRERREARRAVAQHLDPALVDRLSENSDRLLMQLEPARIQFILLQVRDNRPDQVAARLASVHAIVTEKDGTICDVMSSITLSVFGFPETAGAETDTANRAEAAELMRALIPDVRLVHGAADGLMGNSGSPLRFHYGPVVPHFAGLLQTLVKLEFGTATEVTI